MICEDIERVAGVDTSDLCEPTEVVTCLNSGTYLLRMFPLETPSCEQGDTSYTCELLVEPGIPADDTIAWEARATGTAVGVMLLHAAQPYQAQVSLARPPWLILPPNRIA